ncbi:MAG: DUF6125 family protein [Firmicutes bacterium]|nr:DUF6125 family protein [Bacillota bacterium]
MPNLTGAQIAEYFQRSYTAVDGLWFMKLEEKYGFEAALEIDREVWRVFPKIQARKLKSILGKEQGLSALAECLTAKHTLESFTFATEFDSQATVFKLIITQCPWYDLMRNSGRKHLANKVGRVICNTEYPVWAGEFGAGIRFELQSQLCDGSASCILQFSQS